MSRIGNAPIKIPQGVEVNIQQGGEFNHLHVVVTGPKGTIERSMRKPVSVEQKDGELIVTRPNDLKQNKSFHGLYRALLANMITGVSEGYKRELEIIGIGYRAEDQNGKIVFSLGYSHKIDLVPPQGISVVVQDQTQVIVEGIDKQLVGEVAAKIRAFRKPEPYKGKGVRYKGEQIIRKSVKQA